MLPVQYNTIQYNTVQYKGPFPHTLRAAAPCSAVGAAGRLGEPRNGRSAVKNSVEKRPQRRDLRFHGAVDAVGRCGTLRCGRCAASCSVRSAATVISTTAAPHSAAHPPIEGPCDVIHGAAIRGAARHTSLFLEARRSARSAAQVERVSTISYYLIGHASQRRGRAAPRGEAPKSLPQRRHFRLQRCGYGAAAATPRGEAPKSVPQRRHFRLQRCGQGAAAAAPQGAAARSVCGNGP